VWGGIFNIVIEVFERCVSHLSGVTVIKYLRKTGRWWLTPVILATQEAEIRRITF
jgi:hypothetical protein